ncbi:class I SAM-dependent methyltransferase [Stackebrandtia nassauensis]|uniref:Methyltransferase type 11 n=1 Tax=Stackebrandtia nassauensis (strain DSM 44728 / CIP 108903 / NRRL B-16338 / NBRC 102104 / LLR-40K-21) TaxID=446470 RepID=D3Q9B1_STANL|nr:class I SAM-dependent methyltransferase [Stackebrandtia nassauensis]ADD42593.1 Methyltransferase type 11 [Stackebrandtia nassauensis DSM 44728]
MTDTDRERLRQTFTEDAELYDRARSGYPARMYEDLAELTGLKPDDHVLELGCGTGQATVSLARQGYRVTAVELGAGMATVARRNLASFPDVEVVNSSFEDWPLPSRPFDVVFSATAFYWIDPDVRMDKSADALRLGGALATVTTHHVKGGSEALFARFQDFYERFDPSTPPGLRLEPGDDIPCDTSDLESSERFGPPEFRRYEWDLDYSTQEYLDVLRTYSGHRALDPAQRDGLLGAIGDHIDRNGGRITKRYMTELRVTHRVG